jgi:NADP-dependent 3-hydroxy acid dehydrogenase YdfG
MLHRSADMLRCVTLQPSTSKDFAMPSHNNSLVVVITGASSGIGRATAHAFAEQGAAVVLGARRVEMLREVEQECIELGGSALAVPTDTTQEDQVENLAAQALKRFGRIDVWFNNAGVGVFGRGRRPRCVSSAPRATA